MRVLLTGASGFVGRHVAARAVLGGHAVRALVRSDNCPAGVEAFRGDLSDVDGLAAAVSGVDAVAHLAVSATCATDGTQNLLTAMRRASVRRLVLVSSLSVYSYQVLLAGDVLHEESPLEGHLNRRDEYCRVKMQQELLARRADLQLTVLRPGAIFGPGRLWTARLGQRLGPLVMCLGGNAIVPLCYVEHVADAVMLSLERPDAVAQTLNLVDDDLPTQREYLTLLRRLGALSARSVDIPFGVVRAAAAAATATLGRVTALPALLSPESVDARAKPLRYANHHAKHVLGWGPRWALDEAVTRSVH